MYNTIKAGIIWDNYNLAITLNVTAGKMQMWKTTSEKFWF